MNAETRHRKTLAWVASLAYLLVWGLVDWRTGSELSLSVFYLPAVAWVAWHGGRWQGVGIAFLAGGVWLLAELGAGGGWDNPGLTTWNAFVRFGFFCITGTLLAEVRDRRAAEKELAAQRAMLGKILDALEDGVLALDGNGRRLLTNPAAEVAISEANLGGDPRTWWQSLRENHVGGDLLPASPQDLPGIDEGRTARLEFSIKQSKETGERRFEMEVEPIKEVVGEKPALLIVTRDRTEKYLLEKRISEVSEFEKRQIGQEIHDGLCQQLAALSFHAAALQQELDAAGQPGFAASAGELRGRLQDGVREARELSHGLFPAGLEDGLASGLRLLASTFHGRAGFEVRHEAAEENFALSPADSIQLYRIAQEAVMNAIRHSGGTSICLRLSRRDGALVMEIDDNGRGITEEAGERAGIGLAIMRHRAGLVHGHFRVEPLPGGGTRVVCRVGEASRSVRDLPTATTPTS